MKLNRREALRTVSASVGALFVAGATNATNVANAADASLENVTNPAQIQGKHAWKYVKLDPDAVADFAYNGYPEGRCMHTTFTAIVMSVAKELEKTDPVAARAMYEFPFYMFHYGASGGNGLGTLCGALNAAMAAINLFVSEEKMRKAITGDLALYYEHTLLPVYKPADAKDEPFPQTIANSALCHVSSGKWCELAMVQSGSPERTERCSRLSADIARKTVELLNLNIAGLTTPDVKPIVSLKRTEPTATCVSCHDKGGTTGNIIGSMTCNECHPEKTPDHHSK